MAAAETSRVAPFGAVAIFRIVQFVTGVAALLSARNDARITRNALDKLSDHELADIGLSRGDIALLGR